MIDISVKVNGGLFSKNIDQVVRDGVYQEVIDKLVGRIHDRGGKGIGERRNTKTRRDGQLEASVTSTRIWPRTVGSSWQKKNVAIANSLAPRAMRKYAERVVKELG